jgi:hypothetical protein
MRAIIAARKSNKVHSATGEGIGLDTQDEKAREFADRLGITVVGVARDTISGRMAPIDRPDLSAWLSDPAKPGGRSDLHMARVHGRSRQQPLRRAVPARVAPSRAPKADSQQLRIVS